MNDIAFNNRDIVIFLSNGIKKVGRVETVRDDKLCVSDYFGSPFMFINKDSVVRIIGKDWGSVISEYVNCINEYS